MKTMKKIFASILVMCMVLAMPNMAALADGPDGSMSNPFELTLGEATVTLTEQAPDICYKITAPATDTGYAELTLTIESEAEGMQYELWIFSNDYEVNKPYSGLSTDDVEEITLVVPAEKEIIINIWGALFTSTWNTSFEECAAPAALGSVDNKDEISFYGTDYTDYPDVTVGQDGYYYVTEAPMDGTLEVSLDYDAMLLENGIEAVVASVTVTNVTKNNATATADAAGEKAELEISAGDEIIIHIVISSAGELTTAEAYWAGHIVPEEGSEGNPIVLENGSYTTENPLVLTVPAGKAVYYMLDASNVGMTMTISGSNFMAAFGQFYSFGMPVSPTEGVVTQVLTPYYSNMQQVVAFAINNTGDEDATYSIVIQAPLGTEGNPEEIKFEEGKTEGSASHEFAHVDTSNGSATGIDYFFKWVATEDGYVRITASATYEGEERVYYVFEDGATTPTQVTVEGDVWYYYAYNTAEDGDVVYSFSKDVEDGTKVANGQLIAVNKGDVVIVRLMALDVVTGVFADSTVKAELEYVDLATGSEESAIKDIENFTPVEDEEPIIEIELKDENGETSSVISKEVLEALKDKDLSVMMYFGSHYWVINGQDIETAEDLDLSINFETTKIPEALVNKVITDDMIGGGPIELVDNDDFGLVASLVFDFGTSYSGCHVNLFYYNAEGNLECVATNTVNTDGLVAFNFEHASEYVVQISEDEVEVGTVIEPDKTSDTTTPGGGTTTPGGDTTTPGGDTTTPDDDKDTVDKLGDLANPMIYVIVLLGAALVGAGFVAKKRFA